jgi:chlorobactene glucosyltransferase
MWALLILSLFLLLGVLSLIAVSNALIFPRLALDERSADAGPRPFVSILVPARNEAVGIGATVGALLAQDYPYFEVLVLDDASTDATAAVARQAAGDDSRLWLLAGEPLPAGWLGKSWACCQLAQAAHGDILIFADADVGWRPGALRAVVAEMVGARADLLTVWPTQRTETWGERLVVPLMALTIIGYLPVWAVHCLPWPVFAAANGQCLVFRRAAYDRVGGHAAVRNQVVEDMAFARAIKARRLRLRMADGAGLIVARMYQSWSAVRAGFAKNILQGHGGLLPLLLSAVFHWMVFLFPWIWLALGWAFPELEGWPRSPLLLAAMGVGVRALSAAVTRQRVADALLMPLSVGLMTVIAAQSVLWRWRGGGQWKGRAIVPLKFGD